jgi:serine/threonine protein kinase
VADFGIVKLLSEEPDLPTYSTERTAHKPLPHPETTVVRLTRVGTIIGTWAYLSPEAVTGQTDRVGPRSDVWALGVILYQMLTGAYPFPGQEPAEITTQILDAEPEAPGGDPTLARIVMRCLRKEQADRYPSAAALADDLEAWVNGRPPRGVPASRGYWLRWQVRRWWRAAASVLLLLSVGVARSWDAVAGQISCPGRWTS